MTRAKKDVDTPHITCQKCGWDLSFLYDTIEYDTYRVVYYHCPVCRRLSTVTVRK